MSAYLALYPAVASLVTSRLIARVGAAGLFIAPMAWVATEYLRGYFLTGFPWVPLGNSQVTVLPVAQLASVLGVYGLSALVAYINTTLAYSLVTSGTQRVIAVASAVVVLVAVGGWGAWRIADGSLTREGTPIRVGLIQGNIAQEDKWNPAQARRIFTTYIAMTRDAVRRGAEYVIWPESSTPFTFEDPLADPAGDAMLRQLAREVRVPILFGSDQVIRREPVESSELYNAAYQLDPDGKTIARLPQDSPRPVWRILSVPAVDCLCRAARSAVRAVLGRHRPGHVAGRHRIAPARRSVMRSSFRSWRATPSPRAASS